MEEKDLNTPNPKHKYKIRPRPKRRQKPQLAPANPPRAKLLQLKPRKPNNSPLHRQKLPN